MPLDILVISNDPHFAAEQLASLGNGLRVHHASNVPEGKPAYDVIIVDAAAGMPQDTIQDIENHSKQAGMPVFVVSDDGRRISDTIAHIHQQDLCNVVPFVQRTVEHQKALDENADLEDAIARVKEPHSTLAREVELFEKSGAPAHLLARKYFSAASSCTRANRLEDAMSYYRKLLSLPPDDYTMMGARVQDGLARLLEQITIQKPTQKQRSTITLQRRTRELEKENANVFKWLWQQRPGAAHTTERVDVLQLLSELAEQDRDDPEVRVRLARMYALKQDKDNAWNAMAQARDMLEDKRLEARGGKGYQLVQREGGTNVWKFISGDDRTGFGASLYLKAFAAGDHATAKSEEHVAERLRRKPMTLPNRKATIYIPHVSLVAHPHEPDAHETYLVEEAGQGITLVEELANAPTREVRTDIAALAVRSVGELSRRLRETSRFVRGDVEPLSAYVHRKFNAVACRSIFQEQDAAALDAAIATITNRADEAYTAVPDVYFGGHTSASPRNFLIQRWPGTRRDKQRITLTKIDTPKEEMRCVANDLVTLLGSRYCGKLTEEERRLLMYLGVLEFLRPHINRERLGTLDDQLSDTQYLMHAASTKYGFAAYRTLADAMLRTVTPEFGADQLDALLPWIALVKDIGTVGHKGVELHFAAAAYDALTDEKGVVANLRSDYPLRKWTDAEQDMLKDLERRKESQHLSPMEEAPLQYLRAKNDYWEIRSTMEHHLGRLRASMDTLGLYQARAAMNKNHLRRELHIGQRLWPKIGRQVDLKVHTNEGSGQGPTVEEAVENALQHGVAAIAIADIDTTIAVPRAQELAYGTDLTVIPAAELTADYEGEGVHVIAYFLNKTPAEGELQERFRLPRLARMEQTLERMLDDRLINDEQKDEAIAELRKRGGSSTYVTIANLLARMMQKDKGMPRHTEELRSIVPARTEKKQANWILMNLLQPTPSHGRGYFLRHGECEPAPPRIESVYQFCRDHRAVFGLCRVFADATSRSMAEKLVKESWDNGALVIGAGHTSHSEDERNWLVERASNAVVTYVRGDIKRFKPGSALALDYETAHRVQPRKGQHKYADFETYQRLQKIAAQLR